MRRTSLLITIFTIAMFAVMAIVIWLLYTTALAGQAGRLREFAQSQARMIESMARHEERIHGPVNDSIGGTAPLGQILAQVNDAHAHFAGFGHSGEFTMGRRAGDSIVYVLTHRQAGLDSFRVIPFKGRTGEPMRRALSGLSGTVIGLDYRGATVLAAYEPVGAYDLGVVAKIDLAEVRAPFLRAALIGLAVTLLTVLLGSLLFYRVTNPVLKQIQESEARLRGAEALAHLGSWTLDLAKNELTWSDEAYRIFGLRPQEFGASYDAFLAAVHPDDRAAVDAAYSDSVRDNRDGYEIEHRIVRKDTGEVRVVEERCRHVRDAAGHVIRSTGMVHDITERRAAEEAVRRNEARLRGILDATGESVWLFDADGVVLQANAIALARFGKTGPEVLGKSMEEILSPELARSRTARLREVVESARPLEFEDERAGMQFRHSFYPVLDRAGLVTAVASFSRDITERKLAEKALRDANAAVEQRAAELQAVLDVAPVAIWIAHDPQCLTITGNACANELIMRVPVGANISASARPGDAAVTYKVFRAGVELKADELPAQVAAATGKPVEVEELDLVFSDGRTVHMAMGAMPLFDAAGRVRGSIAAGADITALAEAKEALRESEERFRSLAANLPSVLMRYDRQFRIEYLSPPAEAMTGIPVADFLGKTNREVGMPEDLCTLWEDAIDRVFRTGKDTDLEFDFSSTEGPKTFFLRFSPEIAGDGTIAHVLGVSTDITARKQAEEALRESEERLRKMYSAMSEGLALHELVYDESGRATDYRIIDINPRFEEITGISRANAVGRLASELYGTGSPPYIDIYSKVAETAESAEFETEFAPMAKSFHISAFSPSRGTFATVFTDISERRRNEVRLAEQAAMLASVNDAIVGYDTDYRVTFWNRSAESMYGYSEAEALGRVSTELFQPVYVNITREQLIERLAADGHLETESIRTARDGRQLSVEAHVIALRDEQGKTTGYVSVDRDITARKQAEDALRRSDSFNRSIIDSSRDCIKILDMDGRLIYMSPAGQRLLGIKDVATYLNVPYEEFWRGSDRTTVADVIRKAREGQSGSFRGFCPTADGTPKWWDVSISPVLGADGQPESLLAVSRDITDRREADEELRRSRERQEILADTAAALLAASRPQGLVEGLCRRVMEHLDCQVFVNFLVDEPSHRLHLNACAGVPPKKVNLIEWLDFGQAVCGAVAESGKPIAVDHIQSVPDPRATLVKSLGADAYCCHPLLSRGKVIGTLSFGTATRPVFTAEEREMMKSVADLVAVAMQRVRSEEALSEARDNLEVKVRERTAELSAEVEERKRAEERLAASSQYVRSLIESSLDPLVTISPVGKITDVNEATIRVTGVSREQLVGTDFCDYFTEPERAREGYRLVFAEGSVTDYPLTIRHRDGRLTDVLYNAGLYRDAQGVVSGVFAAARDVTDRKRAEEAAVAERRRFHEVLDMLPAYVILLAPDYTVPFANRFFEERFGKAGGFRCFEYLFHRDAPCENCESFKVLESKGPHHWEWLGPDGHSYDISDFPFTDVDGSQLILEVGIDITERKQAEQALQKAHDTLEVRVAERTAELIRSNEELEQFAYVASHDLQQPLRMVASYVELLAKRYQGRLDEKADKYIGYASGGARRMQALINDLLAFSRIGRRDTEMEPVDLNEAFRKALANVSAAVDDSGAEVTAADLPTVIGDETQLVQLFQNLLDNAIKFRGKEIPRIRISAERDRGMEGQGDEVAESGTPGPQSIPRSLDPSFWLISVSDNGIGIEPRHAERIFRVFQRLHTEEEYPGTGIGLAICKRVVERHGGRIRVEPAVPRGSRFVFTLPDPSRTGDGGKTRPASENRGNL